MPAAVVIEQENDPDERGQRDRPQQVQREQDQVPAAAEHRHGERHRSPEGSAYAPARELEQKRDDDEVHGDACESVGQVVADPDGGEQDLEDEHVDREQMLVVVPGRHLHPNPGGTG